MTRALLFATVLVGLASLPVAALSQDAVTRVYDASVESQRARIAVKRGTGARRFCE